MPTIANPSIHQKILLLLLLLWLLLLLFAVLSTIYNLKPWKTQSPHTSFPLLWQNTWHNSLKEGKIYFVSWFQRFQSYSHSFLFHTPRNCQTELQYSQTLPGSYLPSKSRWKLPLSHNSYILCSCKPSHRWYQCLLSIWAVARPTWSIDAVASGCLNDCTHETNPRESISLSSLTGAQGLSSQMKSL